MILSLYFDKNIINFKYLKRIQDFSYSTKEKGRIVDLMRNYLINNLSNSIFFLEKN